MSRFIQDIRLARVEANLPRKFRARDLMNACRDWPESTCRTFPGKHRRGNPGGFREYFIRHAEGLYSLIDDPDD